MQRLALLILLLFASASIYGQAQNRYLVYLTDKKDSPYSIDKPEAFLSARSIARRKKQNIAIEEKDLPVNETYINQIKAQGAKVWYSSKWMNAVLIEADAENLAKVEALPFVKPQTLLLSTVRPMTRSRALENFPRTDSEKKSLDITDFDDYGRSFAQIQMLGADVMHQQGYRGQGMIIAVLDDGFKNVDKVSFFRHLIENNQILGTYNFVENHNNVFDFGTHGPRVLSAIAAYKKGKIIGTAPEASFFLFRTEDASSEFRVEEANWLIAAERADSAGVDVINSSLGYTTFDNAIMNYDYNTLDGNTAFITQAADLAAATGMIVVTSAGNEGGGTWQYVGTPADADSIFAVGAITQDRRYVRFSSTGPTADGRIKPDVVAVGAGTVVGSSQDIVTTANGTSFSSPLVCGLATAFWQANPTLSNMEVIQYLKNSGTQALQPDTLIGHGIPNFARAQALIQIHDLPSPSSFQIYPNPLTDSMPLRVFLGEDYVDKSMEIKIFDNVGNLISEDSLEVAPKVLFVEVLASLNSGVYLLQLSTNQKSESVKIVKQ